MPELPEVEVTRLRLERNLVGLEFEKVVVRVQKLRLPVPAEIADILPGRRVLSVGRRGKYLLIYCDGGCLVIHLGMTGYLQLVTREISPGKHDHLDFVFVGGMVLRFNDSRKFGLVIWTVEDPLRHPLLASIGPEPLTSAFDGSYLFAASRSRTVAVKLLIMNSLVVAGVGNIYANEALFLARIHPARPSLSLSPEECERLTRTIKEVLTESIGQGSTYKVAEEMVGYHPFDFQVYGRGGIACTFCGTHLQNSRIGNRSSVFCLRCQR